MLTYGEAEELQRRDAQGVILTEAERYALDEWKDATPDERMAAVADAPIQVLPSIKPRGRLCVVVEEKPGEFSTAKGLIIPARVRAASSARFARVVAVGDGMYCEAGNRLPIYRLSVGDRVLVQIDNTTTVQEAGGPYDGLDLLIVNETDILAVVSESVTLPAVPTDK